MFQIGCGKADITAFIYGKGMMGYGMHHNVVKGVETPLSVRAFIIRDKRSGRKICFVNAEICFYTIALKDAIVKKLSTEHARLGYNDSNLMLSAQHTHSGAGGYSHYMMYNLTIPGFQPKIFNKIVEGTVTAILMAEQQLGNGQVRYVQGSFAPQIEVAFNRSLPAHNNNPEILYKFEPHEAHLAIDRTMKLFRLDDMNGSPVGSFNFFGVHTTSISNDNHLICYDNKGYAAEYFEQYLNQNVVNHNNNNGAIVAFAQDAAGDVSPNFVWDKKKKWMRGKYEDDFKSARHNGHLQFEKAKELFEAAAKLPALGGEVDYGVMYVDFSKVEVSPEFVGGRTGLRTVPAAQGISFFEGTKEGPGMPKPLTWLSKVLITGGKIAEKTWARWYADHDTRQSIDLKYETHGKKHIFMESGEGRVFSMREMSKIPLPNVDLHIKNFKWLDKHGYLKRTPWVPQILPLQIITIGPIAILGIPAEITTIAGKRLIETVSVALRPKGIHTVLLSAYTNGYHGYITTPEEYDLQLYEGGHTVFGKWTLPAYQTMFRNMAVEMCKPPEQRNLDTGLQPDILADDEIWYGFDPEKFCVRHDSNNSNNGNDSNNKLQNGQTTTSAAKLVF